MSKSLVSPLVSPDQILYLVKAAAAVVWLCECMPVFWRLWQEYVVKNMECWSGQQQAGLVYVEELTTCNDTCIMYVITRLDAAPKYASLWNTKERTG